MAAIKALHTQFVDRAELRAVTDPAEKRVKKSGF
jgi:hypothetical protein